MTISAGEIRKGDVLLGTLSALAHVELPALPTSPGWARRQAEVFLGAWQIASDTIETAVLVVSELTSNAVQAPGSRAAGTIALALRLSAGRIVIEVSDHVTSSALEDASSATMDTEIVAAYLERMAARRPRVVDADALRDLHRAHQMTVPFENLSIHLGEPISLDEADLISKIVDLRRGGFCYELNGAFALLLVALGAQVTRVAARVYGGGQLGPPFDHLALVVRLADGSGPWLADVGFGSHSDYPLRLDSRHEQADPCGTFALADADDGDVDVLKDGAPAYRVERRERALADFVPTCWWQQTAPGSHFTRNVICSRRTDDGRISISGRTLIVTSGGSRAERELTTDRDLLAAYRDHFGISLDRVPERGATAT